MFIVSFNLLGLFVNDINLFVEMSCFICWFNLYVQLYLFIFLFYLLVLFVCCFYLLFLFVELDFLFVDNFVFICRSPNVFWVMELMCLPWLGQSSSSYITWPLSVHTFCLHMKVAQAMARALSPLLKIAFKYTNKTWIFRF